MENNCPNIHRRPDWSLEEIRILRELYPNNNTEDLRLFLNRSASAIAIKAHKLGLKKSDELHASGLTGRFTKKAAPWYTRLWKRLTARCND